MKTAKLECPICKESFAVPHADSELDLLYCVLGCPACGRYLYVKEFGEIVLYDDKIHLDVKPWPQGA